MSRSSTLLAFVALMVELALESLLLALATVGTPTIPEPPANETTVIVAPLRAAVSTTDEVQVGLATVPPAVQVMPVPPTPVAGQAVLSQVTFDGRLMVITHGPLLLNVELVVDRVKVTCPPGAIVPKPAGLWESVAVVLGKVAEAVCHQAMLPSTTASITTMDSKLPRCDLAMKAD